MLRVQATRSGRERRQRRTSRRGPPLRGRSSLSLSWAAERLDARRGLARAGACIISDCRPVAPQCQWPERDDPGASARGRRARRHWQFRPWLARCTEPEPPKGCQWAMSRPPLTRQARAGRRGPAAAGSGCHWALAAANMLNALSGMNLPVLGLACAICLGNFVFTVDPISTGPSA